MSTRTDPAEHPEPVEAGHVEHAPDCPGGRVREHETAHRLLLVCAGCGAHASRPRVSRWRQ